MLNTTHKLLIGVIGTGIAEWLHRWAGTLAGIGTFVFMMMCAIEKWPIVAERLAAGWRRMRGWLPLFVFCVLVGIASSGCQYAKAKKTLDEMKAASVARVEAVQNATRNVPTSSIVTPHASLQEAQASGAKWYYIGGALSGIIGIGLLAATFRAAGAVLILGALVLPLLVNIASSLITTTVCAVVVAVSLTFVAAWFIIQYCKYAKPSTLIKSASNA